MTSWMTFTRAASPSAPTARPAEAVGEDAAPRTVLLPRQSLTTARSFASLQATPHPPRVLSNSAGSSTRLRHSSRIHRPCT